MDPTNTNLIINVPPGHGKSVMLSMWVAWALSKYPNSQFLYISYGKVLATKHTEFIKRIISTPHYGDLFGVKIRHDSKAKDFFQTTQGGTVKSFGSSGAITGQDGGLPNCEHFSGAVIMDDMHKPDEVHSDTIRQTVIDNYRETILQRPRAPNVPMVFIGQRLHEDDLPAYMLSGDDERTWKAVVLKAIDDAGNALYPDVNPLSQLREKQDKNPYVFASQFQQDPIPAGGALFKPENFLLLASEPDMLTTFITADTAETAKSYNDASVFSFWGVYEIIEFGQRTGQHALHWLDCWELRVEPKDLRESFMDFFAECMLHPVKPRFAAIEKKSTGVTLISTLKDVRGLDVREVKRTKASGSKTVRFLEMQPLIAAKMVTMTEHAKHVQSVIAHMQKITANDTHRHDDICYVAGSRIATTRGYVNIEDITLQDKVITPFGIGTITACGSTGFHNVIKNIGLEGTPNHPILYENKFIPLITVPDMIKLNKLSFMGLLKWRQRQLLYSMEKNLDCLRRDDILLLQKENIRTNFFTVLFGNFIRRRKYQKATWFTIKTITNLIIVSKIWNVFQLSNIVKYILKDKHPAKNVKSFLLKCESIPKSIINRKKGRQSKGSSQLNPLRRLGQSIAPFVQKNLLALDITLTFAHQNASETGVTNGIEKDMPTDLYSQESARIVKMNTQQRASHPLNTTAKPVQEYAQDDTVMKEVFNLTVETYGVYYVNNILSSNCDTAYDAIKIALIDKTILYNIKQNDNTAATIMQGQKSALRARSNLHGGYQNS